MMRDYQLLYDIQQTGKPLSIADLSQFVAKYLPGPPIPLSENVFTEVTFRYQETLNMATIGASGAVFGVLAAFVYLFPNTYIYIYFLFPIKAKWLGILYFTYELFFAVQNSAGDNVARWAHVGGALVGLLIVITWNRGNRKQFF
jgi:membrane associated rhomboid family serine protease